MEQVAEPDHIEVYAPDTCQNCGSNLKGSDIIGEEERQVFDIPALRIEVTAHRVLWSLRSRCPHGRYY